MALSPWFSSSWSSLCRRICVVDPSHSCPSHLLLRFGLGFKYGADKKALRCWFEVYHGSPQAHRAVCTCHTRGNFVNLRCSCWEETLLQMRALAEGVKLRDVLFFLLLLFFPANALIYSGRFFVLLDVLVMLCVVVIALLNNQGSLHRSTGASVSIFIPF